MPFVVKATGLGSNDAWLSPKSDVGVYTLGPRKTALVFPTEEDARRAMGEAVVSLKISLVFSVEAAN